MIRYILDASALAKRCVPERGSPFVNHLFTIVGVAQLRCLTMGVAEAFAVILRYRNGGRISEADANSAVASLYHEVIDADDFVTLSLADAIILHAMALIQSHNINTTDACVLQTVLDIRRFLAGSDDKVVLVASDGRLLRAARAEGLAVLDPENGDPTSITV